MVINMKVKICGIYRIRDADYINKYMPDYAGFVFYKKSHRYTDDDLASALRKRIDSRIKTVGVFVDEDKEHIAELYKKGIINIIQLHGHEDEDYIRELRKYVTDVEIWQAFAVREKADLEKAQRSAADMIILDNGYGTGKCFDWSLIESFKREFILAGGINPENIRDAAERFSPWALDLSSGVETDRIKDEKKIAAVIAAVRSL